MAKRKPLIDSDGEVRELTAKDMTRFKPAAEVLTPPLRKKLGVRGPQKASTKQRITIRLSREVVERFRESGEAGKRAWIRRYASGSKSILRRKLLFFSVTGRKGNVV